MAQQTPPEGFWLCQGTIKRPLCIIFDLRSPGMNGLELQAAEHSLVPIVFASASEEPAARGEALNAGAVAFLASPSTVKLYWMRAIWP
jgi:CheY-like chemotaxis protein